MNTILSFFGFGKNSNNEQKHQLSSCSDDHNQTISVTGSVNTYAHPLLELVKKGASSAEIINLLETYCCCRKVGIDENGESIYDVGEQFMIVVPVTQLFSYCVSEGRHDPVVWMMKNYVPLQVSYDNNSFYLECMNHNHTYMAGLMVAHESFQPDVQVMEYMLRRGRYDHLKICMMSKKLSSEFCRYRFTMIHYIDHLMYEKVSSLFNRIKENIDDPTVIIPDVEMPDPEDMN